ncbi:hypothetical protein [Microbacterium aurantiacum]|uniref:hypothetical protein n=1 Tax=Microbacterium aurantiacum TaxID=162393 RepID=UPI000C7FF2C0|nr:hypothetical protein [Microbacterium aurantiacum]
MPVSFDEFHAALLHAETRDALGVWMSDAQAQHVHADDQLTRSHYAHWLAANPQPVFAAGGEHDFFPTEPLGDAVSAPVAHPSSGAATRSRNTGLWVLLSTFGALILIALTVVVIAFTTAHHWTKVDVPEQPETFHSEEYETGLYDVTMDAVNPCWVDQPWADCTNAMVAQYNAACADVELTVSATSLCEDYLASIDEMKAAGTDGVVASLGTYGHLHRTAEMSTREVSNDDYRPAVTHEAVCYLGFIGECE